MYQPERLPISFRPDPRRVILRPFSPGPEPRFRHPGEETRITRVIARVLALTEDQVEAELSTVERRFADRHPHLEHRLLARFQRISTWLPTDRELSVARRELLGAYFLQEYAWSSVALFNPSMVPHPEQTGTRDGETRFILSMRATGEGHISSVCFLSGFISSAGEVRLESTADHALTAERPTDVALPRDEILARLMVEGVPPHVVERLVPHLPDPAPLSVLAQVHTAYCAGRPAPDHDPLAVDYLLDANFDFSFPDSVPLSARVIFPMALSQSNGLEDARFVRLTCPDGSLRFVAPVTAYDGRRIRSQLLETADFRRFSCRSLSGPAVANKGMALFPEPVNGRFAMLGRQDGENIHLMASDDLHVWTETRVLARPREPWEFIQLGNCGSPILLDEGWLVFTHGVGFLRSYAIGALLLDRDDPSKVLGRSVEPLIEPGPEERDGYVPNVAYSCGGMRCGEWIILPFAFCDTITGFSRMRIRDLLASLH